MTAAIPRSHPGADIPPPRHAPMPKEKGLAALERAMLQAERQAGEAVDRLLSDYLRLLEIAGNRYARETERAMRAYTTIETPARKVYERQTDIAQNAYDQILGPADAELQRVAAAAQDMYRRAIAPIEAAYAQAVNDALQLTQGMALPAGTG